MATEYFFLAGSNERDSMRLPLVITYTKIVCIVGFTMLLVACDQSKPTPSQAQVSAAASKNNTAEASNPTLTLAVYQADNAQTVYRQFQPLADGISQGIEKAGGNLRVELKIYKGYDDARDALVNGQVDFARLGPASFVLTKERDPGIKLLAVEQKKGKTTSRGLIIVPEGSPIQMPSDLKGVRFAFGDPTSTIGRYLVQSLMIDHQIFADDLSSFEYLGRHDKVLESVRVGDFDAGALKESTYKKLDPQKSLRVLVDFENVTKPWVARSSMNAQQAEWLTQALISLSDPEALATLGVDGFVQVQSDHFENIRLAMEKAKRFDATTSSVTSSALSASKQAAKSSSNLVQTP